MRSLVWLLFFMGAAAQAQPIAQALYPDGPPPPDLSLLVVEYDADGDVLARHAIGDPAETSWWPASTVKLFAAIAALETVEALHWGHHVQVAFMRPGTRPYTRNLAWLVQQAITHSSNLAYDRLVQFVGHDRLHTDLLGPDRGLSDTALQVPYSQNVASLLDSPAIELGSDKKRRLLPAREGKGTTRCAASTCTSLNSLVEAMRRIMFNAVLWPGERLRISPGGIQLLKRALAGKRKRGTEVVDALRRAFRGRKPQLFHKPGYYPDWRSDVVFLKAGRRQWAIALANRGGRKALNDVARRLGRWLARSPVVTPPARRSPDTDR